MNEGPVKGKNARVSCPFVEPENPLKICECLQTFKTALEMPFRAVWVGV
jgi:hypothetical protein